MGVRGEGDGYRLAVHVEPGGVRAITRGGYDWTKKFGLIVAEARELGHASMILDGECSTTRGGQTSDCCSAPSERSRACTMPARFIF